MTDAGPLKLRAGVNVTTPLASTPQTPETFDIVFWIPAVVGSRLELSVQIIPRRRMASKKSMNTAARPMSHDKHPTEAILQPGKK
jgi:hypothetical protein